MGRKKQPIEDKTYAAHAEKKKPWSGVKTDQTYLNAAAHKKYRAGIEKAAQSKRLPNQGPKGSGPGDSRSMRRAGATPKTAGTRTVEKARRKKKK